MLGTEATMMTGAKSPIGSKGSLPNSPGFMAKELLTMSSVYPSAGDFATNSAAILPLAPGRFSTTTVWPTRLPSSWPSRRASASVPPPGGNVTMRWIGLAG